MVPPWIFSRNACRSAVSIIVARGGRMERNTTQHCHWILFHWNWYNPVRDYGYLVSVNNIVHDTIVQPPPPYSSICANRSMYLLPKFCLLHSGTNCQMEYRWRIPKNFTRTQILFGWRMYTQQRYKKELNWTKICWNVWLCISCRFGFNRRKLFIIRFFSASASSLIYYCH